ncbi:MAG: hypothetical protein WAX69_01680, partial [Victivallales bacterium]
VSGGSAEISTGFRSVVEWDLSSLAPGRYRIKALFSSSGTSAESSSTVAVMQARASDLMATVGKLNGFPVLKLNGKATPFWMRNTTHPEISLHTVAPYGRQGVHIHGFDYYNYRDWVGEDDFNDIEFASRCAEAICYNDPEGVFMLRPGEIPYWYRNSTHVGQYPWSDINTPADINAKPNFWNSFPSSCAMEFNKKYGDFLVSLTKRLRQGAFGDRFLGLWIAPESYEGSGREPVAQVAFKEFLRKKYDNDVGRLRAGWNQPSVDFDNATIPSKEEMGKIDLWGFFRMPSTPIEDYLQFRSGSDGGALLELNRRVKEVAGNGIITVRMNGYINIESHGDETPFYTSASLDAFCTTCYYSPLMRPGAAGVMRLPADSVALAGKIFIAEFDHDCDPWAGGSGREADDSLQVVRRSVAQSIVKGYATEWYDIPMEYRNIGQYTAPAVAGAIALGLNQVRKDLDAGITPDMPATRRNGVAFVIDERGEAVHITGKGRSRDAVVGNKLRQIGVELPFIGVRVDSYRLADISKIPDYPMLIFYMCYRMSDEEVAIIKKRFCTKGHTVVFVWPPALFGGSRPVDLARSSELCGIELRSLDKPISSLSRIVPSEHPFSAVFKDFTPRPLSIKQDPKYWPNSAKRTGQATLVGLNDLCPGVLVADQNATTIALPVKEAEKTISEKAGTYPETDAAEAGDPGLASVSVKEMDGWTSVYSAVAYLPAELLREMAKARGVHVYDESGDAVWVSDRYVAVHVNAGGGKRALKFPFAFSRATELFSGRVVLGPLQSIEWEARPCTTTLWMLERK